MYRWAKLLPIKAPDVTSSRTERERDLGDAVSLRDLIRGMPALSCVVDCATTCFALHNFFRNIFTFFLYHSTSSTVLFYRNTLWTSYPEMSLDLGFLFVIVLL